MENPEGIPNFGLTPIAVEMLVALVENATATIINDDALVYAGIDSVKNIPDNEILYFFWYGEDGDEFSIKVNETCEPRVDKHGHIYVFDDDGDEVKLTLLAPVKKLDDLLK